MALGVGRRSGADARHALCTGRAPNLSAGLCQIVQNVLQDTAGLVVLDLIERIDAANQRDLLTRAVGPVNGKGDVHARRDGAHWVLDGEKTWISNGGIADVYCVFARTGEAPGAKGI